MGKDYPELWVKYSLYIPENFRHRCPVGLNLEVADPDMIVGDTILRVIERTNVGEYTIPDAESWGVVYHISGDTIYVDRLPEYFTFLDGYQFRNQRTGIISQVKKRLGYGHNNKFFILWQGDYGSSSSGNVIDFEFWSHDRGNSRLSYYPSKDHGAWRGGHTQSEKLIIDQEADAGKWVEVIIHVKIASSSNNDGIIHIWKNGEEYLNVTDLPNYSELGFNYFQYGYLLGWSNSGYEEETIMYIDDVVFSTKKISSNR